MKIHPTDILVFEGEFRNGKFPMQRLGQAFCNHFGITNPDLFYIEDTKKAQNYIWENY